MQKTWDVIIIGGGAAGLMCAQEAGRRGCKVLLLEHQEKVGKKILISGGGRCNFTNIYAGPENYISQNPHFCKSALSRYTPYDFIGLLEAHGIAYYEKKLGQQFCRDSAQNIVTLLLKECQQAGVRIETGQKVTQVTHSDLFQIETESQTYTSKKLVLASGGLSIPKIGASSLGYRILKQFMHKVVPTRPALVPLTYQSSEQGLTALKGIAVDVNVETGEQAFRENLLFTHFGLSGPAILQISSYWKKGEPLSINLLPGINFADILNASADQKVHLHNHLLEYLPKRLVQYWKTHYLDSRPLNQYSDAERQSLASSLQNWQLIPAGSSGYSKAEVTVGGADTQGFSSKTMASRSVPGLYCIGELMDVTGWLGGYNFQWAWASAVAAGEALAQDI